jgi:hypothetical protein
MQTIFDSAAPVKSDPAFGRGIDRRPFGPDLDDLNWAAQCFGDAESDRELEERALQAAWDDQFDGPYLILDAGDFPPSGDAALEIDQQRTVGGLLGQPGIGVGGDLQDEEAGLGPALAVDFEQAVGESVGLNRLGLPRRPGGDVADSGQAEDRVAMMLNHPFAAGVVVVHR